jgi:ATP-binding cassette subfamily A (ABC1) protein 1
MIGSPAVVFLDEPSTGMDPVARRFMWDIIANISTRSLESCVVLTTHSMEEAEALCSKVGIMVGGRLRCLGSCQHLKNKYAQGFQAEVKLRMPTAATVQQALAADQRLSPGQQLDASMLSQICAARGKPQWALKIAKGVEIHRQLVQGGSVSAEQFEQWWLLENAYDSLDAFMASALPGCALVERQEALLRYKVTPQNSMRTFALTAARAYLLRHSQRRFLRHTDASPPLHPTVHL